MSATPAGEDPLAHLDFTPSVACEVSFQPWTHLRIDENGRQFDEPYDKVPYNDPCPNEATRLVEWRVCPCIASLKDWMQMNPELVAQGMCPQIIGGLCIVQTSMCDDHLSYFIEYLTYPFACPSCGVAFESPVEILVSGTSIKKQG